MAQGNDGDALGPPDFSDLMNRGVESLELLLELVNVLQAKAVLTEDEVDSMGKKRALRAFPWAPDQGLN
jgi:hypothetical protein